MKGFVHFEQRVLALGLAGIVAVTAFPVGGQQVWAAELPNEETSDVYQSIVTGEEMHTVVLTGEEPELYRFVPETSGLYRFYSIGEEDTYGYIYDEEHNLLAEANDGGDGLNFMLEVELEEGTTYYLQSGFFLEEEGEITSVIEAVSETDTYELPQDTFGLDEETTESEEEKREETSITEINEPDEIAADTAVSGDYKYTVLSNGTVKIVQYTGTEAKVTIPTKIAGKTVTVIGGGAFTDCVCTNPVGWYGAQGNEKVQAVTIPKTVTAIQYGAFYNCKTLKTVTFEKGSQLKTIEGLAFQWSGLTQIAIPNKVTDIGIGVFQCCYNLSDVKLGTGLSKIPTGTFYSCTALTKIQIPNNIKAIDYGAFESSGLIEVTIPDSVTELGECAFLFCDKLEKAWIGEGITEIRRSTFFGTVKLSSIHLPKSLKVIGDGSFGSCKITELILPESVESIGTAAFSECDKLQKVQLPKSLKIIESYAFCDCKSLKKVIGGENVIELGVSAFENCTQAEVLGILKGKLECYSVRTFYGNQTISSLKIPSSVTEIQYKAFAENINLSNITFTNNLEKVASDAFENTAWYKKQPNGLVYAGSVAYTYKGTLPANTTLTIKKGTKGIGAGAFQKQTNLVNVKLPNGVKVIDVGAFADCTSLKKIELPSSVQEIGWGAIGFQQGSYGTYYEHDYDYWIEDIDNAYDWYNIPDQVYVEMNLAYDFELEYIKRLPGFVIIADKGSAGEEYAKKYGITYQERTKFNIQYNLNGGKNASGNPATYSKSGNTITLKNPTKSGYIFKGWYTDAGFKNKITKINKGSIGDKTLYAKWEVAVNKLTLNKTKATLVKDETLTLKATVTPTNAANKAVTWKSSNTKVATVTSSGKITAKGVGTAIITCTAKDGSRKSATCKITVRKYTNTEAFVARIYTKALGRSADISGMKYWVGEINARRKTPVAVAELFITSPEFTNKKLNNKEYVKVLYRTFMGREYDQGGLDYWVGRLNKGESRKAVLESFAGCQEFKNIVKSFGL